MTTWLEPRLEGRDRQVEALLYLVTAIAAWWVRTVQDDAFISMRYARNLSLGHGLVFNAGERVEGYTNFLWTLILWIPEHFGWSSPAFSIVLTVPFAVVTVGLALRLARRVFASESMAVLATVVLIANMTFLGYATSGLETMLQTMLVTGIALALVPHGDDTPPGLRIAAGFVGGLAILTRIDSVVLVAAWFGVHLWWLQRRRGRNTGQLVAAAAQLALPLLVVVVPWLIWKHDYYGALLPNTLKAKSWSNFYVPFLFGIFYILSFFASYLAFLFIGRWRRLRGRFPAEHATSALIAVVLAWFAYICVVGADFMEFRFIVPILPLLALPAAFLIDHYRTPRRQLALVAILLFASMLHRVAPTVVPYPVLTFSELKHWPIDEPNSWESFGRMLHDQFPGGVSAPGQPVLGIIPAGAVPYYAELPAIDMLGLNDRETANHGLEYPIYFPGHARTSTVHYLESRHVSLLLGSMRDKLADTNRTSLRLSELLDIYPAGDLRDLPGTAKVLEIPTGTPGRAWRFIYLTRNAKVDSAIRSQHWRLLDIDRVCEKKDIDFFAQIFAERTCPS